MTSLEDFFLLTPKDVVEEYRAHGSFARFPFEQDAQLLARVGELMSHHIDYLIGAYMRRASCPPLRIVEALLLSTQRDTRMGALQILRGFSYAALPQPILTLLNSLRLSASTEIQYIQEIIDKHSLTSDET